MVTFWFSSWQKQWYRWTKMVDENKNNSVWPQRIVVFTLFNLCITYGECQNLKIKQGSIIERHLEIRISLHAFYSVPPPIANVAFYFDEKYYKDFSLCIRILIFSELAEWIIFQYNESTLLLKYSPYTRITVWTSMITE